MTAPGAAPQELRTAHDEMQRLIAAWAVLQLAQAWNSLNTHALDATAGSWIAAVMAIVARARTLAALVAGSYYDAVRSLRIGGDVDAVARLGAALRHATTTVGASSHAVATIARLGGSTVAPLGRYPGKPVNEDALKASLLWQGVHTIKKTQDVKLAQRKVAGTVQRHVLDAGRERITDTVDTDTRALGYVRVAHRDSCAFCLMLASRGADLFQSGSMYHSERTAQFSRSGGKYHDDCRCEPEPVFSRDQEMPEVTEWAADLYAHHSQGSGTQKLKSFRKAVRARRKQSA